MITKLLIGIVDKVKPPFEKGGRLGFLHSTFDAFETFLFVPNTVTKRGTHIRDAVDMKRSIFMVIVALIPALLFGMYNVGLQHFRAVGEIAVAASVWGCFWYGFVRVLPIIVVSYVVGLSIEFAFAQKRGHEVNEGFLATGLLVPLVMPIDVPLWMVALAVAFAVVFGKEVFGGTGMNVFNPALLARAFVFFAYTPFISGDKVWIRGMGKGGEYIDGFSGATPLTQLAENPDALLAEPKIWDWIVGTIPGSIGETSIIAIALGALFLLFTGVASWRVMGSVFAGGWLMGLLFNAIGGSPVMDMPAYYHLLLGGFAFGAVFMATDPVTAGQTNWGKVIVGFMIGALAVMIRVVNPGYPEGMMLAILFMNALAPLVDHIVVGFNIRRRTKSRRA
ncbi:MAG: NADH:ubiquinone reductase (Na(+)-transporting) subunit B [Alistipes sp.]|jgi:Na+-transporting NADH:ubiquinone oxidoreductase subunit B|nr:NADH:ubiquinone reductase (Na(+)-transporting) subunit B [Alistipes sp.]